MCVALDHGIIRPRHFADPRTFLTPWTFDPTRGFDPTRHSPIPGFGPTGDLILPGIRPSGRLIPPGHLTPHPRLLTLTAVQRATLGSRLLRNSKDAGHPFYLSNHFFRFRSNEVQRGKFVNISAFIFFSLQLTFKLRPVCRTFLHGKI